MRISADQIIDGIMGEVMPTFPPEGASGGDGVTSPDSGGNIQTPIGSDGMTQGRQTQGISFFTFPVAFHILI